MARHRLLRFSQRLGWSVVLTASAVCGAAGASQGTSAVEGPAPVARLRPMDARAAAALQEGLACSATFAGLVRDVEQSDLFIFVETAKIDAPGLLAFMGATPPNRLVRISLNTRELDLYMIGWLGHELRHALEVASAPDVQDERSLAGLYQRIGHGGVSHGVCTTAAQQAGYTVLTEVRTCTGSAR